MVYYRGRVTGLAPLLRSLRLAIWIALWLALVWLIDASHRNQLVNAMGVRLPASVTTTISNAETTVARFEHAASVMNGAQLVLLTCAAIAAWKIVWTWIGGVVGSSTMTAIVLLALFLYGG